MKTITIDNHIIDVRMFADFCAHDLLADGVTVAANALDQCGVPKNRWLATSLFAVTESGAYVLTPRGTDLRASLSSFPVEPKAETTATPCSSCNGEGKKPLLVSFYECERCKGSKVEPKPETAADKIVRWTDALSAYKAPPPFSGIDLGKRYRLDPFVHDSYNIRDEPTVTNTVSPRRIETTSGLAGLLNPPMSNQPYDAKPYKLNVGTVTLRLSDGKLTRLDDPNTLGTDRHYSPHEVAGRRFSARIDDDVVEYSPHELAAREPIKIGEAMFYPQEYLVNTIEGGGYTVHARALIVGKYSSMPVSHRWIQS
jgi:hypothetical protein